MSLRTRHFCRVKQSSTVLEKNWIATPRKKRGARNDAPVERHE